MSINPDEISIFPPKMWFLCRLTRQHIGITLVVGGGGVVPISLSGA